MEMTGTQDQNSQPDVINRSPLTGDSEIGEPDVRETAGSLGNALIEK